MISVYFEVKSGTGRFDSMVRADSIEQAVSIAEARYPGGDARIVYPIDPEAFFVRDHGIIAGITDIEMAERMTR